jgi:hypothetical protein
MRCPGWLVSKPYADRVRWVHGTVETLGDLVTYRSSYSFESDGAVLTSDSTLRFRDRRAVAESLEDAGFTVAEVRGAPDRPGRELVFIGMRPADHDGPRKRSPGQHQ